MVDRYIALASQCGQAWTSIIMCAHITDLLYLEYENKRQLLRQPDKSQINSWIILSKCLWRTQTPAFSELIEGYVRHYFLLKLILL
jgi:hypothetical protein